MCRRPAELGFCSEVFVSLLAQVVDEHVVAVTANLSDTAVKDEDCSHPSLHSHYVPLFGNLDQLVIGCPKIFADSPAFLVFPLFSEATKSRKRCSRCIQMVFVPGIRAHFEMLAALTTPRCALVPPHTLPASKLAKGGTKTLSMLLSFFSMNTCMTGQF